MQVRSGEGVEAKDGIDTLIVLLLADLERAAELEHFCGSPNSAAVGQVEGPLRSHDRFLPLAALYAGARQSSKALSIWQVGLEFWVQDILQIKSHMHKAKLILEARGGSQQGF